jgi:hypothetical protein
VGFAVLQYSLNYPAAIRMSSKNVDLASESLDDELDMFRGNSLDGFLHDVVAILIFDALKDICLKLLH